jgi:hypothetical protein
LFCLAHSWQVAPLILKWSQAVILFYLPRAKFGLNNRAGELRPRNAGLAPEWPISCAAVIPCILSAAGLM